MMTLTKDDFNHSSEKKLSTATYFKLRGVAANWSTTVHMCDMCYAYVYTRYTKAESTKTIFFKQLRQVADSKIIKMGFCQSLLMYCKSTWGGTAKTFMIEAGRAQIMVLKICSFKCRIYPTTTLYEECRVLTVRQ